MQRKAKQPHYAPTDGFNREQKDGRPKVTVGKRKKGDLKLGAELQRYAIEQGRTVREHDKLLRALELALRQLARPEPLGLLVDTRLDTRRLGVRTNSFGRGPRTADMQARRSGTIWE